MYIHLAILAMESGFAVYAKSEEEFQDEIIKTLAGKAGTALIYGIMDIRAAADIKKADQLLDIWLCHFAGGGFSGVEPSENRLSEPRLSYNEAIIAIFKIKAHIRRSGTSRNNQSQ